MPVVDILRLGLSGLVFLLMFLGYRLLQQEQRKPKPSPQLLRRASLFAWQSLVAALLVAVAAVVTPMVQKKVEAGATNSVCAEEVAALDTVAQHPAQTLDTIRAAVRNTSIVCGRTE
jgi:hypothetical protein